MTPREIWNQINNFVMDTENDEAVCNTLVQLYYANKESEAIQYIKSFFKCDEKTAEDAFHIFKEKTGELPSQQQIIYANAVARDLLNKPKCPTCGSSNLKKFTDASKAIDTLIFGRFGTKRYKTFHCNNCGYEW